MEKTQIADLKSLNTIYKSLLDNLNLKYSNISKTITSKESTLSELINENSKSIRSNNESITTLNKATAKLESKNTFTEKNSFNENVDFETTSTVTLKNFSDYTYTEVATEDKTKGDATVTGTPAMSIAGGLGVLGTIKAKNVYAENLYNKTQVDREIKNAVNTTFKYKGQVEIYDNLNNTEYVSEKYIGDVWDVKSNGHNYVWNGTDWDDLGDNSIDLNNFTGTKKIVTVGVIDNGTWEGDPIEKDFHYFPTKDTSESSTDYAYNIDSSSSSNATWGTTALTTGVKISTDKNGHVLDLTLDSIKLPNIKVFNDDDTTVTSISNKDLTLKGDDGITLSNSEGTVTFKHRNTIKSDTVSGSSTSTVAFGGSITIPSITYDDHGHITDTTTTTVTLPSIKVKNEKEDEDAITGTSLIIESGDAVTVVVDSNNKNKITISSSDTTYSAEEGIVLDNDNNKNTFKHYTPTTDPNYTESAIGNATGYLNWGESSVLTGITLNKDKFGHVTGITCTGNSLKMPALTSITQLGNISTATSFVNTTESNSTTSGAVKISGGLGVGGNVYGAKIYNAVWNDIADCIEVDCELESGYCYSFDGKHYYKSNEYMDMGCIGIHSDTAGFLVGNKGRHEMNVAIGGFVLAYVDKEYKVGTPLTCTKDGKLTEIKLEDKRNYPERILATYWKSEPNEEWGSDTKKVKVNGRKWVKIK